MKKLIKFIFIIVIFGFALALLPFTIGGFIIWFIFKKVHNKRIKYVLITIIAIPTLLFGSAWVVALNTSSTKPSTNVVPTVLITQSPTSIPITVVKKEFNRVKKVIDGDTINVEIKGKLETIRLIGIDSPETVDPRKPIQCFGKEASDKAKDVLIGKSVSLEADSTQGERDKYGRLLRFVFLEDGTNFNQLMIGEGYAHEYTYQSNPYKYQTDFRSAEKAAREGKKGLWADDACVTPSPTQAKQTTVIPTQTQSAPIVQPTQSSSTTTGGGSYICNCSKACTQISSCEEAYYQLNSCGCKDRDADSDGVPCESLCN